MLLEYEHLLCYCFVESKCALRCNLGISRNREIEANHSAILNLNKLKPSKFLLFRKSHRIDNTNNLVFCA